MSFSLLLTVAGIALAQQYTLGPDSERHDGVPKGTVTKHTWASAVFPGTIRDYWVYVPAQYSPSKPACLMVFQDGEGYVRDDGAWRAPAVFDNLIHKGDIPVTIGVFINPGVLPALSASQQNRYNRSYEYDGLSDRYAKFLIDEILPEVGKTYNLSNNPNDRAIAGLSSGAIAAFTVAWNRPDAFRRVMSFIGSYTDLRGGDIYPALIRKTEPKPLRIFLQDGSNDLNLYAGDWWMANQTMASALEHAGYEVRFVRGTGGHEARHGGSIFPDALRWLWQGYPAPVRKSTERGAGERHFITEILDPVSEWELVGDGYKFTEGPAVDRQGNMFLVDVEAPGRIFRVAPSGKPVLWKEDTGRASGLMFGPDGKLYAAQGDRKRIAAYTAEATESIFAEGIRGNDLAVTSRGGVYVTEPATRQVWYIDPSAAKRIVNERSLVFPNGVLLSPDEALLYVADTATKWVWSFQVLADGSLANAEPFFRMEMPDESGNGPLRSGADGMTVDTEGYLYVATKLGIQVCDQPGRVVGIISPASSADISNLVFAGPDMQWLYVTEGDKVFRRHLRRKGVFPWAPVKPPQPRL